MAAKAEAKSLPVRTFAGLELETNPLTRPTNSWSRLENFDLFVSGSIRKIQGFEELLEGMVYDTVISAQRNYRRTPEHPQLVIGLGRNGSFYNLETGELLTNTVVGPARTPFVGLMPGLAEGVPGDPSIAKTIQYVVFTTDGFPMKWDGISSTPTPIGVTGPFKPPGHQNPLVVVGAGLTEEQNRGISVLVSRKYRYTYWNPTTRHESSPSLDSYFGGIGTSVGPGTSAQPFPDFQYFTMIQLSVDGPPPETAAQGYTHIRLYATRDGSDEFFLLHNLLIRQGSGPWLASDDDGALEVTPGVVNSVFDGVRDPGLDPTVTGPFGITIDPFNIISAVRALPYQDALMVEIAPLPGENDPPPEAVWGAIYQGRLWLVDKNQQARLVFSKVDEFESFPVDNEFVIPEDDYSPIIALDGQFEQLIIGKTRSTSKIIGTDFTDFVLTPLDPQVGFVGRKALTHVEGILAFLARQGIMQWSGDIPGFYGRSIRPITDTIPDDSKLEEVTMAVDSKKGIIVMGTEALYRGSYRPLLILMDVSEANQPFSIQTDLPDTAPITDLGEVQLSDESYVVLAASENRRVYKVFAGALSSEAIAETQILPLENISQRKVFTILHCDGFEGVFEYSTSVDGGRFNTYRTLKHNSFIGRVGKAIVVRFRHKGNPEPGEIPLLSDYGVDYTLIGESR